MRTEVIENTAPNASTLSVTVYRASAGVIIHTATGTDRRTLEIKKIYQQFTYLHSEGLPELGLEPL